MLPCGLKSVQVLENYGERGRNRTFNLLIKSQLLCQLSYAPLKSLGAESITYAEYTVPYRTRPMHAVPAKFPTCVTKSCEGLGAIEQPQYSRGSERLRDGLYAAV